jgi:hypothetical protein
MIDIDGKPFSTALIGVVTLVTCYVAGWTDWAILVLPLLVMVAFWLAFRPPAPPTDQPATTPGRAPVRATEGGIPPGTVATAGRTDRAIELGHHQHAPGFDLMLHQQGLDTTTPAGKAIFQMMGVIAEFERAMIRKRVQAGFERGRAQGTTLRRLAIGATTDAGSATR